MTDGSVNSITIKLFMQANVNDSWNSSNFLFVVQEKTWLLFKY
jgi:hypothetical protein